MNKTQGQSQKATPHKERGYAEAIRRSITISFGKQYTLFKYFYWLLDLNCGCGYNTICKREGSPIVFLREAQKQSRKFIAAFCDINSPAIDDLEINIARRKLLPEDPNEIWYYRSENNFCLSDMARYIKRREPHPKYAMGSVFLDPNGVSNKSFSLKKLVEFSNEFPRMDLILNWNYSQAKRCRGQVITNPMFYDIPACRKSIITQLMDGQTYLSPKELMGCFNKKHWLVMEPVGEGVGYKFIMLIGRNIQADESGSLLAAESSRGRAILDGIEEEFHSIQS